MRDWKTVGKKFLFPPFWLILLLSVILAVVLEFMIDRSGVSRLILYALYVLVLCVPAAAGCIFYKRSHV